MKALYTLVILFVLIMMSSCNNEDPFVAVPKNQPIRYSSYTFYFNNAFHTFQGTSDFIEEPNILLDVMKDSIETNYHKLSIPLNIDNMDSVWIVNYPSGLSQGRGADYVACISGEKCKFDIYFPYELEGSYSVELTDDEYLLFYGLLRNMLSKNNEAKIADSISSDSYGDERLIYVKTFSSGVESEYLKMILSSDSEEYVLDIYMMILLRSRISPSSFLDSVPRLNNVLDSYNSVLIGSSNSGFTKPEPPPPPPPPMDPTSDTEDLSILEEEL